MNDREGDSENNSKSTKKKREVDDRKGDPEIAN
jgi:hypothetical protein